MVLPRRRLGASRFFYIRPNISAKLIKVPYVEGKTYDILSFINRKGAVAPYCGYIPQEYTNVGDLAVQNPTINDYTKVGSQSGYAFTPEEDETYVLIQQSAGSTGIVYPFYRTVYVTTTKELTGFYPVFYAPNYASDVGMVINGVEYKYSNQEVTVSSQVTIGVTFRRNNSIVAYKDIVDIIKSNQTTDIYPFFITTDGVRVECYRYLHVTNSATSDTVLTTDLNYGFIANENYPSF